MAHNLERWVDGIVLRTFAHETVTGMADYAAIPVINALERSGASLPGAGRLLHSAREVRRSAQVKLAYVGDGNNVAHSLMLAAAALGSHICVATPQGLRAGRRDRGRSKEAGGRNRARRSMSRTIR